MAFARNGNHLGKVQEPAEDRAGSADIGEELVRRWRGVRIRRFFSVTPLHWPVAHFNREI